MGVSLPEEKREILLKSVISLSLSAARSTAAQGCHGDKPTDSVDLDLRADLKGAGAKPAGALDIDAHTHAHLHGGRLQTDGWIASPGILRFSFDGELPAESLAQQPSNAPIKLEARLEQVDLAKLAATGRIASLERARVHGLVDLRISAAGTLAQPRATGRQRRWK